MVANNKYVLLSAGCVLASILGQLVVESWPPLRHSLGGVPIIPMIGTIAAITLAWLGRKTRLGTLWLSALLLYLLGVYLMYVLLQPNPPPQNRFSSATQVEEKNRGVDTPRSPRWHPAGFHLADR
jgi:hypothetical protein